MTLSGDPPSINSVPESTPVILKCEVDDANPDPHLTIIQSESCDGDSEIKAGTAMDISKTVTLNRCHNGEPFLCKASGQYGNVDDGSITYNVTCEYLLQLLKIYTYFREHNFQMSNKINDCIHDIIQLLTQLCIFRLKVKD